VDLDRMRIAVVPGDEWRQMFREAWRLQRDQFWTPDMSGVDWAAVHDRWLPLVDRVATRAEFSDLLWEMQGELGTSHSYEMGGDYRPIPAWHQGFLGADLALDRRTGRWVVSRVPRGDPWDPKRAAPLSAPGVEVPAGSALLAVDGMEVGRGRSPEQCLVNRADQVVRLLVRTPAGKRRTVSVRMLRSEYPLRYRDWVVANRERVHRESGGRVGYVHVPDMGANGYAEFHRAYRREVERDGLIVDVRFNGGGHVSQLLLEKLLRRRIGYDRSRWGTPTPYPSHAPLGPMVAITNEYAGSDGDMFSHAFKLYGLGPLIGKRTWGGVVGIWPRHALVDGTVTTQPEFSFWFVDLGYGLENRGTDPDIEVEIRPQDHARGTDPQLERALSEVEAILRREKPRVPDFGPRPTRRPPRLPGRGARRS
jgi:tricorn protease